MVSRYHVLHDDSQQPAVSDNSQSSIYSLGDLAGEVLVLEIDIER